MQRPTKPMPAARSVIEPGSGAVTVRDVPTSEGAPVSAMKKLLFTGIGIPVVSLNCTVTTSPTKSGALVQVAAVRNVSVLLQVRVSPAKPSSAVTVNEPEKLSRGWPVLLSNARQASSPVMPFGPVGYNGLVELLQSLHVTLYTALGSVMT